MQTNSQLNDLQLLWQAVLGEVPPPVQFVIRGELHTYETIRHGIAKTAVKNLQVDSTMTLNHKIRFASSVMQNRTVDKQKIEGQRLVGTCTQEAT